MHIISIPQDKADTEVWALSSESRNVEDWEADSKEEAEEWFNSFTGSYDDVSESACLIKPKLEECDKLEETIDTRPNETRMIEIIEDN